MNVLFLTYGNICRIDEHGIYSDLLNRFIAHRNDVYSISPRYQNAQNVTREHLHQVFVDFNIGRAGKNIIKKGLSTIQSERIFLNSVKTCFPAVKFDLVLYTTPPITFVSAVRFAKKRDKAAAYLLLKDIFPQNAVDLGMMPKSGLKGLVYRHFRKQEKQLYAISDRIGCMSQANADYVIRHNPEVDPKTVEVCPNSIDVFDKSVDAQTRAEIRKKYGIPENKRVFVYGGNLGRPQGIPFLIECLKRCRDMDEAFFLIVGDGTEYGFLEKYAQTGGQKNLMLMQRLPKEDYDTLVGACDVGLIFLDHRFTIPNFPSRLLAYMQAKLPVIACTDPNTDIGTVITEGGFGSRCESSDSAIFAEKVGTFLQMNTEKLKTMGDRAFAYLNAHYTSEISYGIIVKDQTNGV